MSKKGFQVDLIPNMYELGLFRKTLSSRRRLRITTAVAIAGLCALFAAGGYYIHYKSDIFWVNAAIIITLYIGVLVTSLLLALTLGDVFFQGPWREKMAKGDKFIPADIRDQQALIRNKSIYFILLWFVSLIALGFGCDQVTGGHVYWYQHTGMGVVSMRSNDATERLGMVRTIAKLHNAKMWQDEDVKSTVVGLLDDSEPEIRSLAAYICGRAGYFEGVEGLMRHVGSDPDSHVASTCAISLGRLEWKPARSALILAIRKAFSESHKSPELIPSLLYAFYEMKDALASHETIQMLETCLEAGDCDEEIFQYGFFYLKSMKISEAADLSFKVLESEAPHAVKCLAADSLRFASRKTDVPKMKEFFEKTASDLECPVIYRKYHEEAAVILFEADPMRALYLRAIGNYMDAADYDWIWMIGSNESEDIRTRKVAEIYTRAMLERGIVK